MGYCDRWQATVQLTLYTHHRPTTWVLNSSCVDYACRSCALTCACILMWQENEQPSPELHLSPYTQKHTGKKTNCCRHLSCIPAHVPSAQTAQQWTKPCQLHPLPLPSRMPALANKNPTAVVSKARSCTSNFIGLVSCCYHHTITY